MPNEEYILILPDSALFWISGTQRQIHQEELLAVMKTNHEELLAALNTLLAALNTLTNEVRIRPWEKEEVEEVW